MCTFQVARPRSMMDPRQCLGVVTARDSSKKASSKWREFSLWSDKPTEMVPTPR